MNSQISMFELLDEWDTALLPIEKQKKGTKAWIIEVTGIFEKENGFTEDYITVGTRPIVFRQDTYKRQNRTLDREEIWQNVDSTHGPYRGWVGYEKLIFCKRPTWNDCIRYGRQEHREAKDIRYGERTYDFEWIHDYENGYGG